MNILQKYENAWRHKLPVSLYEGDYGLYKSFSIAEGYLYYVKRDSSGDTLCRVNLQNTADRAVLSPISSAIKGDPFHVLCTEIGIFVYRYLDGKKRMEIHRWEQKDGQAVPLPTCVVDTPYPVIGFSLQSLYCVKKESGVYTIFAVDIEANTSREIFKNRKEFGRAIVMKRSIAVYDFSFDEDSISCPTTDFDLHIIYPHSGKYVTKSGMFYLVDASHELLWEKHVVGNDVYLESYRITSLAATNPPPHFAPILKLPFDALRGRLFDKTFCGHALAFRDGNILFAYDKNGVGSRLSADCVSYGFASDYLYVRERGETKLFRMKIVGFEACPSVEQLIL